MREKRRRKWAANDKLRIVLTCLQPGVEVSEVCRREEDAGGVGSDSDDVLSLAA